MCRLDCIELKVQDIFGKTTVSHFLSGEATFM
jgi:hypothetical protein